jgi:DNA-binding MarR family transcriptional regulator
MRKTLSSAAKLRELLFQFEKDLGMGDLSWQERDILYAFQLAVGDGGPDTVVHSDTVRSYPTVAQITHSTYHRALKSLLDRGLIRHAPNRKAGAYVLNL